MKALFATAGGLALLASSALANPVTEASDSVTLNAVVQDYIAIVNTSDSTLTIDDVTEGSNVNNNDTNANKEDKALFTVIANVDYDIVLDWETWDDVAGYTNPTPGWSQANYYNSVADCSIGGGIKLDPNPNPGSPNDAISGGGSGTMTYDQGEPTFGHEYGIGTEASPNHTTCGGDIAAPGTYSLDVDITVSKAS